MKIALARTAACIPALVLLLACVAGAAGLVAQPEPALATVTTILWLLGAGGAVCLLLLRAIDADDRGRELAAELARERGARQLAEAMLADTQTVLSRFVRQQDTLRDGERDRIACGIHEELGQVLLSLRIELSLLQVASSGIHPTVHQKTGEMVKTLDLALHSLRVVVEGLRPLGADEHLDAALARQLDEFSRLNGIMHTFEAEADAGAAAHGEQRTESAAEGDLEADTLLYRVLQEALANIAGRASATEVQVRLRGGHTRRLLEIADNGAGSRTPGASCGCGLSSMRPRIEALGGELSVASGAAGTRLSVSLPRRHGMLAA